MKALLKVLAIVLVLAICVTLNHCFLLEYYNDSVLYGSFAQKRERADSIASQKVLIVGGSSSNLAFDSECFEQLSGIPAVNLSISAGVPLKVYMRAADLCAKNGDVVIVPLEYSYYAAQYNDISESYVDMVGVDPELKCKEKFYDNVEFYTLSFLRSFTRMHDCILWLFRDAVKTENTIYTADSVNEYGDFCLHKDRPSTYTSQTTTTDFQYNRETMDQISAFIERMEDKGVTVYLTYPCVDKNIFVDPQRYFSQVQQVMKRYIPEDNIIGTPDEFAYDPEFFFDTAYHIRYENRGIYTQTLFDAYQETAKG